MRQLVVHHDLPVERDGRGRVRRFSLAHYDHIRGQFASSEKVAAARKDDAPRQSGTAAAPNPNSRDEALRQEAWLKVTREHLRHQEEIRNLIRADRTQQGLATCGREIQNLVDRLQNKADDMALAVTREGVHGLRVLLRKIAAEINTEIADKLDEVFQAAPEHDEPIEGQKV
ncbi:MAG: hypothetical protein AB7F74_29815 [Parvibaculaceae bacterium]